MGRRRMSWGRRLFRYQLGLEPAARYPRYGRVCARCGFSAHLAGPLVRATVDGGRWLCRNRKECASRRLERELHEVWPVWARRLYWLDLGVARGSARTGG